MSEEQDKAEPGNLTPAELAAIEARFRQRRARRGGGLPTAVPGRHRPWWLLIGGGLLLLVVSLLAWLPGQGSWLPLTQPPGPRLPPLETPPPVPDFGASAHLIAGARVVPGATLAPLAGLAVGSEAARAAQRLVSETHRLPIEIENSIGMRFRLVPAGTYLMGSPKSERYHRADELEHVVVLPRPFYLGKFEVTQAEWALVMGAERNPSGFRSPDGRRPVEEVTWPACQEFLRRLAEREQVPAARYRLPTEEEWEYACRAGTQTAWCFGDDEPLLPFYAGYQANSKWGSHPVGQYRPNAWGFHDLHGNVWEWCQNDYYFYDTKVADSQRKSLRGGTWYHHADDCRSASRFRYTHATHGNMLGLRVLRTIEASLEP